jgi:hypothetical protein
MGGCCGHATPAVGNELYRVGSSGNNNNGNGGYGAIGTRDMPASHTHISGGISSDNRPSSAPLRDARLQPLPNRTVKERGAAPSATTIMTMSGNDTGRSQTPPVRGSAMHKTVSDSVTSLSLLGGAQRAKAMANPAPQHRAMVAAAREAAAKDTSGYSSGNGNGGPLRRANLRISRHAVAHVSLSGLPRSPSHSKSQSISMSTNLRLPSVAGNNAGPYRISSRAPHFTEDEHNQLRRLHIPPNSTREGDMLRTAFSYACPAIPITADTVASLVAANTLSPKTPGSPQPLSSFTYMSISDFLQWVTAPDPEAEHEKEEDDAAAAALPGAGTGYARPTTAPLPSTPTRPLPLSSSTSGMSNVTTTTSSSDNDVAVSTNPHASLVHQLYIQHLFTTADISYTPDTKIGFVEWLKLLTIATYSKEQLLLFAFRALDTNEDGMIDNDDLSFLAEALAVDHFSSELLPSLTDITEESLREGIERKTSLGSIHSGGADRAPSAMSAAAPLSHRPSPLSNISDSDTPPTDPERILLAALARWPSSPTGGIAIGFNEWGTLVSDTDVIMAPVLWLQRTIRNKSLSNEIWQHIRDSHANVVQPPSPSHMRPSHHTSGANVGVVATSILSPSITYNTAPINNIDGHQFALPGAV